MRMNVVCAALALSTISAQAASDDTRCPVSPELQAVGVKLADSDVSVQKLGTLVTCHYISDSYKPSQPMRFDAYCPKDMKISFPGYSYSESIDGAQVVGVLAASGSNSDEFGSVEVTAQKPAFLKLKVFALCR